MNRNKNPHTRIPRKPTLEVDVGGIKVGGNNPIVIQSMTNTPTAHIHATVAQIKELADAGSELVRITVDTEDAAKAVPSIIKQLKDIGITTPIIGDFHFNGHILLEKYPEMAQALAKYRINPGNTGKDENFKKFIEFAIKYQKPVRIGVNAGSPDKELLEKYTFIDALVQSCLLSVQKAQDLGLSKNKIILGIKISNIQDLLEATEKLSQQTDCPLHIGLTEAGGSTKGLVASSAALGILLQKGIGDTIRYSLTPAPGTPRSLEVQACKFLLQTMGFRDFQPLVTSCPGCGRTSSNVFQMLAQQVNDEIEKRLPLRKKLYPGCEKTKIAVMGCVVNGIGEASTADIGIFFPGNMENPGTPVYVKGKMYKVLQGDQIFEEFMDILELYFQGKI